MNYYLEWQLNFSYFQSVYIKSITFQRQYKNLSIGASIVVFYVNPPPKMLASCLGTGFSPDCSTSDLATAYQTWESSEG